MIHRSLPADPFRFYPPTPSIAELAEALRGGDWLKYLTVIVPMGLFNLIGSLQNIESAEAAGDSYPTAPSLAVNGLGSVVAAAFGSCFPTTIYIGHPGWKAMGARAGYSTLNGLFFTAVGLLGLLGHIAYAVPVDAGMAIVLWIGLVITAQAFQATPREHAPAVVVGLLPGLAGWVALLMQQSLQAGRTTLNAATVYPEAELMRAFENLGVWFSGVLALEQGFIFTSSILAATTVALIERRFVQAGIWCTIAAALSAVGFMHGYAWLEPATTSVNVLHWGWSPWATGYAAMAACFFLAPLVTEAGEGH